MTLTFAVTVPARDVSVELSVAAGETLALLGPNGAGKSTLLAAVAGLVRPADCRVGLGSRTLADVRQGRPYVWTPPHRRSVGLLAQDPGLFPHLSALDNVAFGPRCRGVSRSLARLAAAEWLDRVGLAGAGSRRPHQLSGGQAQRVAVARALATDPEVLLLDEPLAALDVDVTPALRQLLRAVLVERTAVIVTHQVLDAIMLADTVAVLEDGRLVEHGPTREVLTRPHSDFAARIAGLNLVTGHWEAEGVRTAQGRLIHGRCADPPALGTPVVAVFRPAAVAIYEDELPGSPRNSLPVTVSALEPRGDLIRVRAGGLHADITPGAATELGLAPGRRVQYVVKAAEVDIYPARR